MSMNVHAAARAFWQIFLLACPGVVLGTVLMAVVSKCLLPYGWDWNVCLCFGSILAATDPVAVVGLLKNMGASPKLTMLVAGESLMNDGTAIVLFTLFLNMSKGEVYTGWEVLQYFCKVALGGPALGLLFGLAGLLILGMMGKQEDHLSVTCQIALTIALAYGAFFWGEHSARVSGVLCTVTAALVLAFWGWPFFGSRRTVEIIWHTIDFLFNTVVFMLAGVIIGVAARSSTVEAADYGWVIMLYLCATLVRAGMVALLFPALTRIGWGCSPKECVVLWWGGLKGAVGLALAIIVDETEEEGEVDTKHKNMTFLVGGVAVLSLLINGTSCEWLVRRLGLATASEAKRRILAYVRDKICDKATRQYDELAESDEFADHSKELVRRWCTVLRRENFCLCPDDPKPAVGESGGSDSELMATTREVFLQATQVTAARFGGERADSYVSQCHRRVSQCHGRVSQCHDRVSQYHDRTIVPAEPANVTAEPANVMAEPANVMTEPANVTTETANVTAGWVLGAEGEGRATRRECVSQCDAHTSTGDRRSSRPHRYRAVRLGEGRGRNGVRSPRLLSRAGGQDELVAVSYTHLTLPTKRIV
eukprot:TRINITY_DN27732_c0_g1_i5.p1 TRINITY_DN27732_c0_g1~~TRINITY_DN27732_c0_g1_i5.p1  ORF type:complete len:593 (-),score=106.68 TRINITY_DN27732_c0_g1_i5:124-1902(-)